MFKYFLYEFTRNLVEG